MPTRSWSSRTERSCRRAGTRSCSRARGSIAGCTGCSSGRGRRAGPQKRDRRARPSLSVTRLVSGAKLAPQGRLRKAQGASPGNKHRNKGSPEGAMQLVPVPKWRLMTSIYLELRSNSPCAALSGLSAIWTLNPGLAPWAVLLDPFGVLGFAPETSLGLFRMWKAVANGRSLRSNPPSPLNERLPLFEALKSGNGISLLSANHTLPIAMVRCRTWELTGKILGRLEIVLFRVFLGASRKAGLTVSGFAESRCAGRSQDSSWPITAVCSLLLHFAS